MESDDASKIKVTRMGSQPWREVPAEYFTGSVRVDPLFETGKDEKVSRLCDLSTERAFRLAHASGRPNPDRVGPARAECSAGAIPSRKSDRETWCGFRQKIMSRYWAYNP